MAISTNGVGLVLLISASLAFSAAAYGQQGRHDYQDKLKMLEGQKEAAALIESLEEDMAVVMGDYETAVMQPKKWSKKRPSYKSSKRRANNKPFRNVRRSRDTDIVCSDPNKLGDTQLNAMQLPGTVTKAIKDYLLISRTATNNFNRVDCDTRRTLTMYDLMQMANSMFRDEWGYYPTKVFQHIVELSQSFAYLPNQQNCNPKLYKSSMLGRYGSGNIHATRNAKDSEMFLTQECPAVRFYWSAWSPCSLCVHSLIDWKQQNHQNEAVAIYVATLYIGKNTDKDMTLNCLALMMKKGFIIRPWSWQTFSQHAGLRGQCAEVVGLIPLCKEFKLLDWKIKKFIKRAKFILQWNRNTLENMCPDPR